jgi:hypothetical protein
MHASKQLASTCLQGHRWRVSLYQLTSTALLRCAASLVAGCSLLTADWLLAAVRMTWRIFRG